MAPIKEWFGIYSIIFDWFEERYGYDALVEYWKFIADSCFPETVKAFKDKGLEGIREYVEETFQKDGGRFLSKPGEGYFEFEVTECPDYAFFHSSGNRAFAPHEYYCKHHEVINSVLSEKSGFSFHMTECDNNGRCKWVFKEK